MLPSPNPMDAGGPPPPPQMGQPPGGPPTLGNSPNQASALGGAPAGLSGSPDPQAILAKAEQLLKSGAISQEQFQLIVAKLGLGKGPQGAQPGAPPLSTTGVPGGGPPVMQPPQGGPGGPPPSPAWGQ